MNKYEDLSRRATPFPRYFNCAEPPNTSCRRAALGGPGLKLKQDQRINTITRCVDVSFFPFFAFSHSSFGAEQSSSIRTYVPLKWHLRITIHWIHISLPRFVVRASRGNEVHPNSRFVVLIFTRARHFGETKKNFTRICSNLISRVH